LLETASSAWQSQHLMLLLRKIVGFTKSYHVKDFEMHLSLSELSELIMDQSVQFYHLSCNIGSFFHKNSVFNFPGEHGTKRSPWFCFTPGFWCHRKSAPRVSWGYRHMFWLCELTVTDFELVVLLFHMWEFLPSNLSLETRYPLLGICGFYHLSQQVPI